MEPMEVDDTGNDDSRGSEMVNLLNMLKIFTNIFDKSFFNKNNIREQISQDLENISPRSMNYLFSSSKDPSPEISDQDCVAKEYIFDALKTQHNNLYDHFRMCIMIYINFTSKKLDIYGSECNEYYTLLHQISVKIASCVYSYKKSNLFEMDYIEEQLNELIKNLLRRIVNNTEHQILNFMNLITNIILAFKKISSIHNVVLEEITSIFGALIINTKTNNLEPDDLLIFATLLNILEEIMEYSNYLNPNSDTLSKRSALVSVLQEIAKMDIPHYLKMGISNLK